jgi:hypothetical protein
MKMPLTTQFIKDSLEKRCGPVSSFCSYECDVKFARPLFCTSRAAVQTAGEIVVAYLGFKMRRWDRLGCSLETFAMKRLHMNLGTDLFTTLSIKEDVQRVLDLVYPDRIWEHARLWVQFNGCSQGWMLGFRDAFYTNSPYYALGQLVTKFHTFVDEALFEEQT